MSTLILVPPLTLFSKELAMSPGAMGVLRRVLGVGVGEGVVGDMAMESRCWSCRVCVGA
jgi:hypothetical protein